MTRPVGDVPPAAGSLPWTRTRTRTRRGRGSSGSSQAQARNPCHPFSSFDTATLGGVAYGQTVLSRIVQAAGLDWDSSSAHSAAYDARITAEVFCGIVNRFNPAYQAFRAGTD